MSHLGQSAIDGHTLQTQTEQLQAWRNSLRQDADNVLCGIDVALDAQGQDIIEQLVSLKGANVAASLDASRQPRTRWQLGARGLLPV